jgi:hypothetical protein
MTLPTFAQVRKHLIFGLGIAFSLKAVYSTDWPTVILALAFFSADHIERYFSAQSIEAKFQAKLTELETALRETIVAIGHVKAAQGIKNLRNSG